MTDKPKYGEYAGITGVPDADPTYHCKATESILSGPPKKAKPVQHIRVKPCGRRMPTLTDSKIDKVTYTCQLERGHVGSCQEKGVVIMDNGYGFEYTILWAELGPYEARRMRDKIK